MALSILKENGMRKSIECIIAIIERGKGEKLTDTFQKYGCFPHLQFLAQGTATSELLDVLGFDTNKRDVIISLAEEDTAYSLMTELMERENINLHTRGIAFMIPVSGISALLAKTAYKIAKQDPKKEEFMENNKDSLILVSLNQGYCDEVMNTAKQHGAKGGTIIRANWADAGQLETMYGVCLHEEKEVLAIVASNQIRQDIMNAIHSTHGLNTKAQALVISLPVNGKAIL